MPSTVNDPRPAPPERRVDAFGNPKGAPTRYIEHKEPRPTPPGRVAT
jgi:hypothetical protein